MPLLTPHLSDELFPEPAVTLPEMALSEHVVEDYVATGLSLKEHPVRFFRERLAALGAMRNAELRDTHRLSPASGRMGTPWSPSPASCWCGRGRERRKA